MDAHRLACLGAAPGGESWRGWVVGGTWKVFSQASRHGLGAQSAGLLGVSRWGRLCERAGTPVLVAAIGEALLCAGDACADRPAHKGQSGVPHGFG